MKTSFLFSAQIHDSARCKSWVKCLCGYILYGMANHVGANLVSNLNTHLTHATIQEAINAANSNDTLIVSAGTYTEAGIWNANKALTIRGESADNSIVQAAATQGTATTRVFRITGGRCSIENMTIRHGNSRWNGGYGGGVYGESGNVTISNCALVNNSAWDGGGAYRCTLNDCVLEGNSTVWAGGGTILCTLNNCTLSSNSANTGGGGAISCILNKCELYRNSAPAGAGAYDCTLTNCVLNGNMASEGAGATISTLYNCMLSSNSASGQGGGVSRSRSFNCTFAGNVAVDAGGGAYNSTSYNCILYYNTAASGPNYSGGELLYCCTTPNPGGSGNITDAPMFLDYEGGNLRLQFNSPCINTGTNQTWMTGATDLDNHDRIIADVVDMGAYEYIGAGGVTVTAPATPLGCSTGQVGQALVYGTGGSVCSDGSTVEFAFNWDDGSPLDWSSATNGEHYWDSAGTFNVRARARCETNTGILSAWSGVLSVEITAPPIPPLTHYVATNGAAIFPYTNWETAARSVQAAINAAAPNGARVLVAPGIYIGGMDFLAKNLEVGSRFLDTGDTNYIGQTILDGGRATRVVNISGGQTAASRLCGFTITNGRAGQLYDRGGGIRCVGASPVIDHVVIAGNYAQYVGGGVYFEHGNAVLKHAAIRNNVCDFVGGGMACYYVGGRPLENVSVTENITASSGGGIQFYHSDVTARNLLVADNSAQIGGGLFFDGSSVSLEATTIAGNRATNGPGGGLNVSYCSHPQLIGSIVWGNSPEQVWFDPNWWGMALTVLNSDVEGGRSGIVDNGKGPVYWESGNLDSDPQFAGDYGLLAGSPCINAGTNLDWMAGAMDLAGNPRILDGIVDMGACEFLASTPSGGWLTVDIEPDSMLLAGAQWRLTSDAVTSWYDSGFIRCLEADDYIVTFKPIGGWASPLDVGITIIAGSNVSVVGRYESDTIDTIPPVIVSIFPPDGYVSFDNHVPMTVVVTDNVAVASVRFNHSNAVDIGPSNTYLYVRHGVRGSFNPVMIVARDTHDNVATQTINYAQSSCLLLSALWDGYWRIRNPFTNDIEYTWDVVGSDESGAGTVVGNADGFFSTSLGPKTVRLYTNGVLVDTQDSSSLPPPESGLLNPSEIDSDNDGSSNGDEELAGTDPNSAQSQFFLEINPTSGSTSLVTRSGMLLGPQDIEASHAVFSWPSGLDSAYTLETSTNISTWTAIPDAINIPGIGATMSYTNRTADTLFYLRIRAQKLE